MADLPTMLSVLAREGHVSVIPNGTHVTWHYRSAIGHGTITGVHKMGTTSANTEYSIHEIDHHPGESPTVYHYGSALRRE